MAKIPVGKKTVVFDKSMDGVYGSFKTSESYELDYLQTTFKISDLGKLETASDAFDINTMSFEELIQRDIDYERVDTDLISGYLEKGKNRVLFFPPILVSLMAVEGGKIVDAYSDLTTQLSPEENPTEIVRIWDKDKFKLTLPISEEPTGFDFNHKDKAYHYYHYASTIEYNSEKVKLVVIDGQHRFVALREIIQRGKKDLITGIQIPVCVFFSPDAIKHNGNIETIMTDLRELFVTINTTAKEVGGHFIDLLDDKSLSSYAVRSLADCWKDDGYKLFLLEWNTREKKLSNQRLKKYSVTTVSIITSCLGSEIFTSLTELLLNLPEVKDKLESVDEFVPFGEISEDNFTQQQVDILKEQIDKYFTPALDVLFFKLRPYSELYGQFELAMKALNNKIQQNTPGFRQFKEDYLFKFRKVGKNDLAKVKDASIEFDSSFSIADTDNVFFLNVFQQGLLRAWAKLSEEIVRPFQVMPEIIAKCLVVSLEKLCLAPGSTFFDSKNLYQQQVIYNGQRVLVNDLSRAQWFNLILSNFVNKRVVKSFTATMKDLHEVNQSELKVMSENLVKIGENSLNACLENLSDKITYDINKNWKFKDYDKQTMSFLIQREGSDDNSYKKEFAEKIDALINEKFEDAKLSLYNMLEIKMGD